MAGADPFAFSMSSFGNLSQALPEDTGQDDDLQHDPFAADRGAAEAAVPDKARPAPDIQSGTLDLGAFGMGGMQGSMPGAAQARPIGGDSQPSDREAAAAAMRRPGTPEPSEPSRPRGREGLADDSGAPSSSGRDWHVAAAEHSNQAWGAHLDAQRSTQQHALAPFEPERFEPLSAKELAQLEGVLRTLAGLPVPGAHPHCFTTIHHLV